MQVDFGKKRSTDENWSVPVQFPLLPTSSGYPVDYKSTRADTGLVPLP